MAQQYSVTLQDVVGRVRMAKPNIAPDLVRQFVNERIREALDRQTYWSGTLKSGVLHVSAPYTTGVVSLTVGSDIATGTGTSWPVNDVVNTTIPDGIRKTGMQSVRPASMAGITTDSVLYVDAAGANPEIVPVMETTLTSLRADFRYTHNPNATITVSSLAGKTLRMSNLIAMYTVRAVTSATTAILESPWAGSNISGMGYMLMHLYHALQPDVKYLMVMADLSQPYPLRLHVSQTELNNVDPQRVNSGPPTTLADFKPNECGNMMYEVYPPQTTARQLPYLYAAQWPELIAPGDRLPYFINPNVIIYGSLASAMRTRSAETDPFYDLALSQNWEMMAAKALDEAVRADEEKAQRAYTTSYSNLWGGGGSGWTQSHAVESGFSSFGGWSDQWW